MKELDFEKVFNLFYKFILPVRSELIIISPFIKLHALETIISKVDKRVKIVVVVRWKILDLVLGSSDLEIYPYLKKRGCELYINNKLHSKILVRDKKEILFGSANVTNAGMGLIDNSNIEIVGVDILDEKYLPDINKILKKSVEVNDALYKDIFIQVNKYSRLYKNQAAIRREIDKAERNIIKPEVDNVLVSDFPFCFSPEQFLGKFKSSKSTVEVVHDARLFGQKFPDKEGLEKAFLKSDAYNWQRRNIISETLFGKYSELLHKAVMDEPRPYRKQIKDLVSNMFNWTDAFSDEYIIKKYSHTKSLIFYK